MDIRVNRVELLNELIPMQGIVERRTTIPVLSHLLLRAVDDRLDIAATDLEVSLTSSCEGEIQEEGAIAIQAKKLLEIVRASDGEEVTLRIDQEGMLTILVGKSRFKVRGLPALDFPTLPEISDEDVVKIPANTFKSLIGKVFYAISSEESRFQLSGALMEFGVGSVTMAATDGHRLALVEHEVDGVEHRDGVLIPRKTLQELQRFDSALDLEFRQSPSHLSFKVGCRHLVCRVLEGTFPDYERVISKDNDKIVTVDRKTLGAVMNRVSLLTGDRSRAIRMELGVGELSFSAANPDLGEATEGISIDYDGPSMMLGINPDYVMQSIQAFGTDLVRLELKDENSQCVVYPVDSPEKRLVCVVMPIRL
jgi:DNA polymerase-3 subunit beta